MSGNVSRLYLVFTSTITIYAGGKITTDSNNNSQKIFIGNGATEWDSSSVNLTGPWRLSDGRSQSTLPVELVRFTADCVSLGIQLKWVTLSEKNNSYFLIEKSNDATQWKEIAKITASENPEQMNTYNYLDAALHSDKLIYYAITQVDVDGTPTRYPLIYVSCDDDLKQELTIFPNPADQELTFSLNAKKENNNVSVLLLNSLGQTVVSTNINITEGYNSFRFPIDLQNGVYSIVIPTIDNFINTKKLVVNHL